MYKLLLKLEFFSMGPIYYVVLCGYATSTHLWCKNTVDVKLEESLCECVEWFRNDTFLVSLFKVSFIMIINEHPYTLMT